MRRKLTSTLAAVSMIGTAAFAEPQAGISTAITDIAAGADRHDWARVRDAFAPAHRRDVNPEQVNRRRSMVEAVTNRLQRQRPRRAQRLRHQFTRAERTRSHNREHQQPKYRRQFHDILEIIIRDFTKPTRFYQIDQIIQ